MYQFFAVLRLPAEEEGEWKVTLQPVIAQNFVDAASMRIEGFDTWGVSDADKNTPVSVKVTEMGHMVGHDGEWKKRETPEAFKEVLITPNAFEQLTRDDKEEFRDRVCVPNVHHIMGIAK